MSTIPTVDTAMTEVHGLELMADIENDPETVTACVRVLDKLLDLRGHLPQQRPPSP